MVGDRPRGLTAFAAWPIVLVLFGLSLGISFDLSINILEVGLGDPQQIGSYAVVVALGILVGLTLWLIARPDRLSSPSDGGWANRK
jgi:hypothetical protein